MKFQFFRRAWSLRQAVLGRAAAESGHAAVDAMVALLIVALTTVLSLDALTHAQRTAGRALEIRRATQVLADLMVSEPSTFAARDGARGGFAYRVETTLTGADRPIEVCRRAVRLTEPATGRRYDAATLVTCPPAAET